MNDETENFGQDLAAGLQSTVANVLAGNVESIDVANDPLMNLSDSLQNDNLRTASLVKKEMQRLVGNAATSYAIKHNEAVITGDVMVVPVSQIAVSINPRQEPASLCAMGYSLVNSKDTSMSLLHLALSDDIEVVRTFVNLIETHEGEPELKEEVNGKIDPTLALNVRTITGLARSIAHKQVVPVQVRKYGESGVWALVYGQRRLASILYLHAKSRVQLADKVEGAKLYPAIITATETKLTATQAFQAAVHENFGRKDFTPLQEGSLYHQMKSDINPKTGKKYNIKQIAAYFDQPYMHVRSRAALWQPRREAVMNEDGTVKTSASGLTDQDRQDLESGKKTLTWAVRRALGESHYSETGERQTKRRKTLAVSAIQKLFDETPADNVERRTALAECMCLTLAKATRESDKRHRENND